MLACFVMTDVLKPSAAIEMVLGYIAAYSSKAENITSEYTFLHKTV